MVFSKRSKRPSISLGFIKCSNDKLLDSSKQTTLSKQENKLKKRKKSTIIIRNKIIIKKAIAFKTSAI